MERTPDLGALSALTHVAESGSISAASAVLGVSQQAVSLRIRSLEADLQLALLVRSARGSQLTEAGELVVGWARPLLAAAADYASAAAALRTGRGRGLRIAASLTIAEHLLPEWIARWRIEAGAGGAAAQLTAANSEAVIAAVRAGGADLGFVETPAVPGDLSSATIGHDQIEIVVAANHPWAGGTVTAGELAETPLVLRELGSGTRRALDDALAAAGAPRTAEPAAVHESTLGARSAIMAGVAPGALSVLAVREDLDSGRLARVLIDGLEITRPLTALWRGASLSAEASALLAEVARPR
ncbi:LysR family transcriptional regulator [Leucobacter komagatae]|uniref:LysR family transcriptional regulator n=1 Tax=Leucobacter komagatae TaxID=55969 RepID=A0A0D0IMU6_9MICO|nr:LysR family transcriptional regulator [Leucobacter komagatae]KIP52899.1 LysR family transcriptional regulator [Leucobacter komagatae]